MKVLQKSQNYFAILGFSSEQSKQNHCLNYKIVLGWISIGCEFVASAVYLINMANSFDEYIQSICLTVAIIVVVTSFASMVFGMSTLFESIDNIESLIETSEC